MTESWVARHEEAKLEPWLRPDVQANRISSADIVGNHPGICYEFGDQIGDPFIPNAVIQSALNQEQFIVAIWQQDRITTVQVSRAIGEVSKNGWCEVIYYGINLRNPEFLAAVEVEPQAVMPQLLMALCMPLGRKLQGQGELLASNDPILRVLIEFPDVAETERLPFDTCLAALGCIAHKSYQDTIYGSYTV